MQFIKICGLQNYAEAAAAVAAGATALGFLVSLTHRAEDAIDECRARDIVRRLPSGPDFVTVTHLQHEEQLAELARFVGVRTIQVHGDLPPKGLLRLRSLCPDVTLIKAIHVTGPEAVDLGMCYAPLADALLLDTRTADRLGGTGQTHDWSISRRIVTAVAPVPVYLAGGLTPENVARAIHEVRPAGVDVNSGVEDGGGRKDPIRMAAFVAAARTALQNIPGR